jgi:hypothetical protein
MDLQGQIQEFRRILTEQGATDTEFALNVAGDGFRALMTGGAATFEVECHASGIARSYVCDGTPGWLQQFADDLHGGVFSATSAG